MVSILEGALAQEIADALADADVPRSGTLRHLTVAGQSPSGETIYSTQDYSFQGWREDYSSLFAAQSGIASTDIRIVVIAKTCDASPTDQDYIFIGSVWHKVRHIEGIDPAGATVSCQCLISDPA
jgi:hypothetical protein